MNASAASLLQSSTIGSITAQNLIKSDHLTVIADSNIKKNEQDIVNNYPAHMHEFQENNWN